MGGGQVGGWLDASIPLYIILFLNLIFFFCSESNEENTNLKTLNLLKTYINYLV